MRWPWSKPQQLKVVFWATGKVEYFDLDPSQKVPTIWVWSELKDGDLLHTNVTNGDPKVKRVKWD